ncbi:MAG: hypothetical protein U9Q03_01040 [Patescibacteria group bacterium]|nr:hypothetical protein [Patescibacteria group bacterium]
MNKIESIKKSFVLHHLLLLLPLLLLLFLPTPTAAAVTSGDLIKLADDSDPDTRHDTAVYYVGGDAKRYVFPNSKVYFSWYENFDAVKTVSQAELSSLMIGGNITYRPGTRLVKIISDPRVYAVEPGGVLRPIASEDVARTLYGSNWNTIIDDVPDAYFTNYSIGDPLSVAVYPSGSLVKRSSDGAVFYIENGLKRHITSMEVFSSLRIQDRFLIGASGSLSEYPDGADLTSGEPALTDTSGKNTVSPSLPPTFSLGTPASTFVGVGTDATLIELRVSSGADATITRLTARIDATTDGGTDTSPDDEDDPGDDDIGGLVYGNNARANLTNIRFVDSTGTALFGSKNLTVSIIQDQSQTLVFTGSYRVPAGQSKTLYLKANVNDQLPEGEGYKATLPVSGISIVGGTGSAVSFLPTTDLVGAALTTSADKLTVGPAPAHGNKTYILGTDLASVVGFYLKANSSGTNIVKSINFQGYIDEQEGGIGYVAGADADNGTETKVRDVLPQVYLYTDTDTFIAGPVGVNLNGDALFSGLSLSIPAGTTQTVVVKADISGTVDLETNPNRLSFDIDDASTDIVAHDSTGSVIPTEGIRPNGGSSPIVIMTVQAAGTMDFDWSGSGSPTVAGNEVQFGTLRVETEDEAYALKTLTFVHSGVSKTSLGDMRLEYTGRSGSLVSVTESWVGDYVTFSGLDIPVAADALADVRLYGSLKPRDAGAVYDEVLSVTLNLAGPIQWASDTSGTIYDESDLGTADYPLTRHTQSAVIVKFSKLTAALDAATPSGDIYRDFAEEVLRFGLTADPAGPVRVKKMSFKITPNDAGTDGADNDSLENWADVNGDFMDDDGIINLNRVVLDGTDTAVGEGSNGRIRYSFAGDDSPEGRDSVSGDYGVISVEFNDGNEFFIAGGTTVTFALQLQTAAFATFNNYPVAIQLMTGSDFIWTDIPSGTYTPRTGSEATGVGLQSSSLTVRL